MGEITLNVAQIVNTLHKGYNKMMMMMMMIIIIILKPYNRNTVYVECKKKK
jgi:hypothetical protein